MKSITSNNSNNNSSNKRRRHRLFPKLFKSTKSKGISSSTNGHHKEECEHHHYEAECDTPTPTSFVYNNTTTPTNCSSRNNNNSANNNNNVATTATTASASSTNNMMSITTSTSISTRSTTNNKLRILDLNNRAVSYYNNKGNCCRGKAVSMFERMLLPELSSSTLMPFLSYLKTPLLTPTTTENDYDYYEMDDNNDDDYYTYSSVFDTLSSTSIELLTLTHNLATMSRLDHNAKRANANNKNNNNKSKRNVVARTAAAASTGTGTTSTTTAAQQQPSRTSYMYQRTDFDEGFRFYDDLQLITRNDNEEQMAAIILYNYGQMKRMEASSSSHNNSAVVVADALHYYEQSYEIIMEQQQKQQSGDSTTTNLLGLLSIPLLHNMGFIYYTTGKIDNAIMCYESVVQHSKKHHLSASGGDDDNNAADHAADDISVGIALNCLSVLKYHQSDDCSNDTPSSNQPLNNEDTISSSSSDDCLEGFQEALKIISRSHVTLPSSGAAENHPDIATILNNIGRVYVQRDEFDTALEYYKRALIIRSKTLGKDSLDYAATAFNVGQSLHKKGQLDEAMILYKEFLHVAKEKFQNNSNSGKSGGGCCNANHRDIAVVLSGMAQIYQEQKEYTKSLELYKESLCVGRAALGEYHTEVASLLNRIGNFYFEIDDMDNALRCYKEGLCIDMVCLQDDTHPNMIITLSNMGEIYKHQKKYEYALRMYNQVLTRQRVRHHHHTTGDDNNNTIDVDDDDQDESNKNRNKKINLPCHEDVASTLNAIGLIYDQMGDYKLSIKYLQDALRMRKKIFGDIPSCCENNGGDATINNPNHLDIASNLMNLGTTYYRKNFTTKALEAFNDAYRIRLNLLGKDNRDVVFVLYNIGLCYSSQCYYREAIDCFTETLRVEKLVLGTNHRDVAMTMYKLGQAYNAQGDFDHALANFKESLRIEQEQSSSSLSNNTTTYKESATTRARILNQIGNIYMARGDVVPMMDAFNDATRILRNAGLNPNSIINTVREQLLYAIDIPCPTAAPAA